MDSNTQLELFRKIGLVEKNSKLLEKENKKLREDIKIADAYRLSLDEWAKKYE